ncbi:MAG: aminotransferase class V-fold PLP-dependent enzyme [Anaerolineae bacterium]|nr:aminotransferase class V-fold PLP-dependent enzyme [Anaerolineae bacterium]
MALRHLPPTATPLTPAQWRAGLRPGDGALQRFSAEISTYLGGPPCFTASSGRTALSLALRALHAVTPERDEVILPAYTCPSLGKVILDLDLRPRLVDLSPQTLRYEPEVLTATLNDATLAVIVVHPFGVPQPVAAIGQLVQAAGAFIIEDAAQALGARQNGLPVGVQGDVGLFSLGPGKPLSTGGGGILCVNNPELVEAVQWAWGASAENNANLTAMLRLTFFSTAFRPFPWWLARRLGAQQVGNSEKAMGYAMSDLSPAQAAVGVALLPHLDAINAARRAKAAQLQRLLVDMDGVWVPDADESAESIYLRLPLLVAEQARRERLFAALSQAGIGVGKMWHRPMAAVFPELDDGTYPGAVFVADHLLTLPTHHFVTEDDIGRIGRLIQQTQ